MSPKPPASLIRYLREGRCVLFCGSGLSAWGGLPCHSPKFCPTVKSTACTLSSTRQFAMTVLHVPLLPAVVGTTGSLLSFASHTALGELGTPTATHRAK